MLKCVQSTDPWAVCAKETAAADAIGPLLSECPHMARYVMIQLPGPDRILNLAEVEVYSFVPSPPPLSPPPPPPPPPPSPPPPDTNCPGLADEEKCKINKKTCNRNTKSKKKCKKKCKKDKKKRLCQKTCCELGFPV